MKLVNTIMEDLLILAKQWGEGDESKKSLAMAQGVSSSTVFDFRSIHLKGQDDKLMETGNLAAKEGLLMPPFESVLYLLPKHSQTVRGLDGEMTIKDDVETALWVGHYKSREVILLHSLAKSYHPNLGREAWGMTAISTILGNYTSEGWDTSCGIDRLFDIDAPEEMVEEMSECNVGVYIYYTVMLMAKGVTKEIIHPTKLNKMREKRGALPLKPYTLITLSGSNRITGDGSGVTVAPHWRRGHIRRHPTKEGIKRIFIEPMWVGMETDGININKEYKVMQ